MVSNGYITREAFFDIYRYIDAANIDLKAFTENFYAKITLTHLQPVLDTLKWLRHETGVWFEITNLIIPTLNDDDAEFKELCDWVLENLGDDVPLHFTAFHPDFKLHDKPATPPETLHRARRMAMQMGLKYVYEGNIYSDGANTICPGCKQVVITRSWHSVMSNRLKNGCCANCGTRIAACLRKSKQRSGESGRQRKPDRDLKLCHPERRRASYARPESKTLIAASQNHPLTAAVIPTSAEVLPLRMIFLISAIFFSRLQPFNCFSRAIAFVTSPYVRSTAGGGFRRLQ